ncbi:hypothetical protein ACMXYX_17685 (plasmid) [Neptuniibacter sp. QD72_48]|uniref:hypothetical protein n=1 Tax=Neptuniibacter sp. QD72_48 TaxID=3398214 RepID=UPI0039F51384
MQIIVNGSTVIQAIPDKIVELLAETDPKKRDKLLAALKKDCESVALNFSELGVEIDRHVKTLEVSVNQNAQLTEQNTQLTELTNTLDTKMTEMAEAIATHNGTLERLPQSLISAAQEREDHHMEARTAEFNQIINLIEGLDASAQIEALQGTMDSVKSTVEEIKKKGATKAQFDSLKRKLTTYGENLKTTIEQGVSAQQVEELKSQLDEMEQKLFGEAKEGQDESLALQIKQIREDLDKQSKRLKNIPKSVYSRFKMNQFGFNDSVFADGKGGKESIVERLITQMDARLKKNYQNFKQETIYQISDVVIEALGPVAVLVDEVVEATNTINGMNEMFNGLNNTVEDIVDTATNKVNTLAQVIDDSEIENVKDVLTEMEAKGGYLKAISEAASENQKELNKNLLDLSAVMVKIKNQNREYLKQSTDGLPDLVQNAALDMLNAQTKKSEEMLDKSVLKTIESTRKVMEKGATQANSELLTTMGNYNSELSTLAETFTDTITRLGATGTSGSPAAESSDLKDVILNLMKALNSTTAEISAMRDDMREQDKKIEQAFESIQNIANAFGN